MKTIKSMGQLKYFLVVSLLPLGFILTACGTSNADKEADSSLSTSSISSTLQDNSTVEESSTVEETSESTRTSEEIQASIEEEERIAKEEEEKRKQEEAEAKRKEEEEKKKAEEEEKKKAEAEAAKKAELSKTHTLATGTWIVGKDIPANRYKMSSTNGESGNFFVYSGDTDETVINEILGNEEGFGIPSYTCYLSDGYEIDISGMASVTFEPVLQEQRTHSNKLPAGVYKVGIDINPGRYTITPEAGQSGNFFVYDSSPYAKINEILSDDNSGFGVPEYNGELEDGDSIIISGMSAVNFYQ